MAQLLLSCPTTFLHLQRLTLWTWIFGGCMLLRRVKNPKQCFYLLLLRYFSPQRDGKLGRLISNILKNIYPHWGLRFLQYPLYISAFKKKETDSWFPMSLLTEWKQAGGGEDQRVIAETPPRSPHPLSELLASAPGISCVRHWKSTLARSV